MHAHRQDGERAASMEPYRRTPGRWANPKPSSTRPAPAPPAASPRPPFQHRGSRPSHQPHRRRWPSGRMQRRRDGVGVGGCGGGVQARGGLGSKTSPAASVPPSPFHALFPPALAIATAPRRRCRLASRLVVLYTNEGPDSRHGPPHLCVIAAAPGVRVRMCVRLPVRSALWPGSDLSNVAANV